MNTGQIQLGSLDENRVLYQILEPIIPDFTYPRGFFKVLKTFIFQDTHSFFDESKRPILLNRVVASLANEDAENLLTVLEGVKALIVEHQLKALKAYQQFMQESKQQRF